MAWLVSLLRIAAAVIASALGTGATMTLLSKAFDTPFNYDPSPTLTSLEPMSLGAEMAASSIICLFLSLPSAILTALVVTTTATLKGPATLIAIITGAIMGFVAGFLLFLFLWQGMPNTRVDAFVLCPVTGALMGLVYWLIAVGPRRKSA